MNENPQTKPEPSQKTGVVKWFSKEKGYGFIYLKGERDYYFNVKNIKGSVLPGEGDLVKFVPGKGKKGPFAKEVVLMTENAANAQQSVRNGRVMCPSCSQEVVPRLAFQQGEPVRSYCPICGSLISNFSKSMSVWPIAAFFIVLIFVFIVFFSMQSKQHEMQREFYSHFNSHNSHFR